MTYTVSANLSNGLTITGVEFTSKAKAEHAAAHLIADYAAEGVIASITITELA
jgi:hypothetical protein